MHGKGSVWVFSGHGSQWTGMGQELLAERPFARVFDDLERVFAEEIGFSPRQAVLDGDFKTVDRIQAMIFAMQMGLVAMLRSGGACPGAVIGHSVGEIGAAVTAGALSLADGARLICRRSALLRRVAGQGAMAMVMLPFAEVAARLVGHGDLNASIASSPAATVVSGTPQAVDELITGWRDDGIGVLRVASDVAFHSPQMEPLLAGLRAAAADLKPQDYAVPVYSTALPQPRAVPSADGAYWAANLRNPVRLVAAVTAAAQDGYRQFLEISPHPVVAHSITKTLEALMISDGHVTVTLRRGRPQIPAVRGALAGVTDTGLPFGTTQAQPVTAEKERADGRTGV